MELVARKTLSVRLYKHNFSLQFASAIIRRLPGEDVLIYLIYNDQVKFVLTAINFYVAVNIRVKMCVVSAEVRPDYLTKTAC